MNIYINIPTLKSMAKWLLRKFGYKIVELDDYKEETIPVSRNYSIESAKCIEETRNGSKFYWSEKYYPGYQKYFEIEGNTRKSFMNGKEILWVKKQETSSTE